MFGFTQPHVNSICVQSVCGAVAVAVQTVQFRMMQGIFPRTQETGMKLKRNKTRLNKEKSDNTIFK